MESFGHPISRRKFQLLAVTCLYTAIKLHGEIESVDGERRIINIETFVELSCGAFQVELIEQMERCLLFALHWHLNPPTPLRFVLCMMDLIPQWCKSDHYCSHKCITRGVFEVAKYFTELAACSSTFTFCLNNSTVAYASILCAMDKLETILSFPTDMKKQFCKNVSDVTDLCPEVQNVVQTQNLLLDLCPALEKNDILSLIVPDDRRAASPISTTEHLTFNAPVQ